MIKMNDKSDKLAPEDHWEERQFAEVVRFAETRTAFEKDRARIVHAPAFRALQEKSELLDPAEGEFYRTRLTHALEVSQIARGIVGQLRLRYDQSDLVTVLPSVELVEALALTRDLGQPPFGHNGEIALNFAMQTHPLQETTVSLGGFQGDAQALRVVTKLDRHPSGPGLNLTRRMLLGMLKYPRPYSELCRRNLPAISPVTRSYVRQDDWKPPKCYLDTEKDVVEWILEPLGTEDRAKFLSLAKEPDTIHHGKTRYRSLDCSIVDLADKIAFATHDLEDGIAQRAIRRNEWDAVWQGIGPAKDSDWYVKALPNHLTDLLFGEMWQRREAISSLIHAFLLAARIVPVEGFESPLLAYQVDVEDGPGELLEALARLTFEQTVRSPIVQALEYRGRQMLRKLFDALLTEPESLLSDRDRSRFLAQRGNPSMECRVFCDVIAAMTEPFATRFYERLFVPRSDNPFERQ